MNLDDLEGDFDLEEVEDLEFDCDGLAMPPKNDKIALIDADTISYTACLNTEEEEDILGRDFYTEKEWEEIIASPGYIEDAGILYFTDPVEALANAEAKIQRILDKTGCQELELHFTEGRNFRYELSPIYKANRTARTPMGLSKLKHDLVAKYPGAIHTEWEADDVVVWKKKTEPDKYILCAVDKDVLNAIEGTHFNYYESKYYNITMKWQETDRHTAIMWRYIQTLTGDSTDNIIGLKGIGPAKAKKILAGAFTHEELWERVCRAYEKAGRTQDEALLNLNLVDMHLFDGEKIRIHNDEEIQRPS